MNRITLTSLFAESLYRIPQYQRGYAWERPQWVDFIQDIDALVDDTNLHASHYTGTVVVYSPRDPDTQAYSTTPLPVRDVVDGQQRLTTACLYLSVVLRALLDRGNGAYERHLTDYLYSGVTCKVTLANDADRLFHDLLKLGRPNTAPGTPHERRLVAAYACFQEHVDQQLANRGPDGDAYLKAVFQAMTQRMHFTSYTIEQECEIGMTFELMNSRGKDLSVLELLKNYLMHWVFRNAGGDTLNLTSLINGTWSTVYKNLGTCTDTGDEDQCLRVAWTLLWSPTPAHWDGYKGFKSESCIPLRSFTAQRTRPQTQQFLELFVEGLAEVSRLYAAVVHPVPTEQCPLSPIELPWLVRIHRMGNIANFLPLLVAARKSCLAKRSTLDDYAALLAALECYSYRVFLFAGRRSNAGKSNFYRWGHEVFAGRLPLPHVTTAVYSLAQYYSPENTFLAGISAPSDWYGPRHRLKYTLFEYEQHLLASEGHSRTPSLGWSDLNDATIEHVLPQTPEASSHWLQVWDQDNFKKCIHDLGNLVLTLDNSRYLRFDFARKKGSPGQGYSYANSTILQERKLARYNDWTRIEFDHRRAELETWIRSRWGIAVVPPSASLEIVDEADEDQPIMPVQDAVL